MFCINFKQREAQRNVGAVHAGHAVTIQQGSVVPQQYLGQQPSDYSYVASPPAVSGLPPQYPTSTTYPPATTGYQPATTGYPPATTGYPPATTVYPDSSLTTTDQKY